MSRASKPAKTGRRERHLARQAAVKAAKKLRRERAARFARLPGQQPTHGADRVQPQGSPRVPRPSLNNMDVPRLRELARAAGCKVRSRHRKADLIAMIEAREAIR